MKRVVTIIGVMLVVGVFGYQQMRTNRLERELESLRAAAGRVEVVQGESRTVEITKPGETVVQRVPMDPAVYTRLTELEDQLDTMRYTADYLMDRGQVPLKGEKLDEMIAKLNDPTLDDQARMEALRLLRRANSLDDSSVMVTLSWLNSATNSGVRENILRSLEGMTNAAMKVPMMQLALNDPNPKVREQAVDNLGRYAADPAVEQQLWDIMHSDAPSNVREEALNAMRRGPMPEHRVAALQRTGLDANASMDERSMALRALRGNEEATGPIMNSLAAQAYNSQDPEVRAQIFGIFDSHPGEAAKVPLVYGLEDPNAEVRRRAADALSAYRDDVAVQEWLQHVAQNDVDSQVRREAERALAEMRRRQRR